MKIRKKKKNLLSKWQQPRNQEISRTSKESKNGNREKSNYHKTKSQLIHHSITKLVFLTFIPFYSV